MRKATKYLYYFYRQVLSIYKHFNSHSLISIVSPYNMLLDSSPCLANSFYGNFITLLHDKSLCFRYKQSAFPNCNMRIQHERLVFIRSRLDINCYFLYVRGGLTSQALNLLIDFT